MGMSGANTEWLRAARRGVGVHWTAQTVPFQGPAMPFADAVAAFDLDGFLSQVSETGARYVLFTLTHALQMLPCPLAELDAIAPGRTAKRDLVGELAEALHGRGMRLIAYYNHSCNSGDDPAWEKAVGYHAPSKEGFEQNLFSIVGALARRYGKRLDGWWFDSAYSLDPRGPVNTVTTDLGGYQFPWDRFVEVAKMGHPNRLVAINAGIGENFLYTQRQDYWAGEIVNLELPPPERLRHLAPHVWTCIDDGRWVFADASKPPAPPRFTDTKLSGFLAECDAIRTPVTFNVLIDQTGKLPPESVAQLARLRVPTED